MAALEAIYSAAQASHRQSEISSGKYDVFRTGVVRVVLKL